MSKLNTLTLKSIFPYRRRNRGGGGPGPPDFFVWGAQYDCGPLTFEKCQPIFELKVTPYFPSEFHFKCITNRARRALTDGVTQSQTEAGSMQMNLRNYLFFMPFHFSSEMKSHFRSQISGYLVVCCVMFMFFSSNNRCAPSCGGGHCERYDCCLSVQLSHVVFTLCNCCKTVCPTVV